MLYAPVQIPLSSMLLYTTPVWPDITFCTATWGRTKGKPTTESYENHLSLCLSFRLGASGFNAVDIRLNHIRRTSWTSSPCSPRINETRVFWQYLSLLCDCSVTWFFYCLWAAPGFHTEVWTALLTCKSTLPSENASTLRYENALGKYCWQNAVVV